MDFYAETKKHLEQVNDRTWILNSSHVLYLSQQQASSYTHTKTDEDYKGFHDEAVEVMTNQRASICDLFGKQASLMVFDLGPEYPDKTLPLLQQMKDKQIRTAYVPVDINADYMRLAEDAARPVATAVQGICGKFEDVARSRATGSDIGAKALAFVGLTFMNYAPDNILDTVKKIGGPHGWFGIASELITNDNTVEDIKKHYMNQQACNFAYGPLHNLGVKPEHLEFNVQFNKGRVEIGFVFRRTYTGLGIGEGDRLISIVSHRYTKADLSALVMKNSTESALFLSKSRKTAVAFGRIPA